MTDSTSLHRLHFDPQGAVLASARECEAEVFLRWYGNTREQLAQEYSRYDAHSTFLALADPDGQVLAAARLISPGPAGLKTLDDISSAPWGVDGRRVAHAARMDLNTTWDVATIGVRRGAARRRGGIRPRALPRTGAGRTGEQRQRIRGHPG